ncbi:MAG: DUF5011 domain-containing protein [Candidatus Pacebacteria bacterium]|nr:DUF5011 domain-containing protein [Candidatus Paceibacterota bacterium]
MLEIIHDMVPDADLYFHDLGGNTIAFNSAIDSLVTAGVDVIVDDIGWIGEPFFEDGIVASHVEDVLANNDIIYISSAGNHAEQHYQGDYYNDGYDFHDFSRGSNDYLYLDIPNNGEVTVILQWNDEFGYSGNDYDLLLFNTNDWSLLSGSGDEQNGTGNPIEGFSYTNNTGVSVTAEIDVSNYNGLAATKILEVFIYPKNGTSIFPNNITPVDSIFGHSAVPEVIAVGAIAADDSGNDTIEPFSSQGPVTIIGETQRAKPDVTGIDKVSVTGAGGFYTPFSGTSAAAPHIAAIATQLWGQYPSATSDQIKEHLLNTAVDLGATDFDNVFGYGRADALLAFEAGPTISATFDDGDGFINDTDLEAFYGVNIDVMTTNVENGQNVSCDIVSSGGESESYGPVVGTIMSNVATIASGELTMLNDGTLTVSCSVTNLAGISAIETSDTSIKDTILPVATLSNTPSNPTDQTTTDIIVGNAVDTETVTHYKYSINGGDYGDETLVNENIQLSDLADGEYTLFVIGKDEAGNWQTQVDPTSHTWTINTVPEDITPPVIALSGINPVELFVGDDYIEYGATAEDNIDGDISGDIVIDDGDVNTSEIGEYVVTYNISDEAGNPADEVTRTVNVNAVMIESIEITNPATKLVYTVGDSLDITDLEITGTYNNGTTQIETITTANITGFDSSAPVDDQILTVTVDEKTTTYTVDIIPVPDTTPPIITEEVPIPTLTNNDTPDYTFISDEAGSITYSGGCSSDDIMANEGNNTITFNALADGLYNNCEIVVTDASDNPSNPLEVSSFTIDTADPAAEETTPVTTPTSDTTPDVGITVESGASWEIKNGETVLDTGVGTGTEQVITLPDLGEGTYNLILVATDEAENTTTINLSEFEIDLSVSPISLSTLPNNPTNETTTGITVSGDDIVFYKYNLDNAGYGGEISIDVNIELSGLAEGAHTIFVEGRDGVGNWSEEISETWTVDLTAPDVPVITNPAEVVILNTDTYFITGTAEDNSLVEIYSGTELVGSQQLGIGETAYSIEVNLTQNADNNFTATATDLAGNESASAIVPTIIEDSIAPEVVITLPTDGLITNQNPIMLNWTVDGEAADPEEVTLIEGENVLTKEATDEAGNTGNDSVTVILDITKPVITLTGSYTINLYIGDTYEELGATAEDNVSEEITIDSSVVDTGVAGTYEVTYNVSDEAGNEADQAIRTVIVSEVPDTTPPVITLEGNNPVNLNVGDTYEDAGATASDDLDGDITEHIIIVNPVDTSTIGIYTITYNVSDEAGNEADEVTRTVNVGDVTSPDAITDLNITNISNHTLKLNWTVPEDADSYDIRHSTAEINNDNFGSATQISSPSAPNPGEADTGQSVEVNQLSSGTIYHFAMKVSDEVPNESGISNVVSATTKTPQNTGGGGGGSYTPPSSQTANNVPLKISSSQKGTLNQNLNKKNKVKLEVPKGSIKSTTTFTASEGSLEEENIPKDKIGAFLFNGLVFNVEAVDSSNKAVREFSEDLTITLTVPDLPDDTTDLELYYYDDEKEEWIIITDIEFGDGTISFKVNHLTQFAVFATKTGEVKGETNVNILDGDIIQCKSSENPFAVYIVKEVGETKYIRHIVSLEIFNYYGHLKWENLKQVDSLDGYSLSSWVRVNTGPNGTAGPTDKVYEINGDQTKHWINMTAEDFLSHGGSELAIYSVNQGELDLYKTGADVMML